MITHHDLQEAIAECQGAKSPNASTCIKLAAYYILMEHLYPEEIQGYSHSSGQQSDMDMSTYDSGTEFSELIRGMPMDRILPVMDELMTTVQVLNPRLYEGVLRKLSND